ncbi:hypothetical protein D8Y22_05205 [Salinadaptatus halalkaliphilus]|uniref:Halobacterial output domain-containing protein n=1 Tax=Salinadaptatus halalkaliphilus TaxID=2419781 RepID=A0A4S3TNS5_9EURY|nr:HalOD1 output domain-containing protein [Salinadaptatus halalkaliphilus]THE65921.1 hypothetical protein D8Y22_05205 [Salinadaptatus halalkaliphilus]
MERTVVTTHDTVCERIVTAVAELEDVDPVELPPLFDVVDPDALSTIFRSTTTSGPRTGQVSFPYAGYDISIEFGDETVLRIT